MIRAVQPGDRHKAFTAWAAGTGYIASIFAPDMQWEIVGRSAVAKKYNGTRQFVDQVLHPFGARFDPRAPFRPTTIRAIYADDDQHTVAVIWDGEGITTAGSIYRNTYAWFMTLDAGRVTNGTAFYDSIAFNKLWQTAPPAQRA